MEYAFEFLHEPRMFLDVAAPWLDARPVTATVVASVTNRMAAAPAVPSAGPAPRWWVLVRDSGGSLVGVGMRTAPHPPYPLYLLEMPAQAARALARFLHERGDGITVVNGAVPTIEEFADEVLRHRRGARLRETERTTLYTLPDVASLREPPPVPGRLRPGREGDLATVLGWLDAFGAAAAEQAGRSDPHPRMETPATTSARLRDGEIWLWEDSAGTPVHLSAFSPPSSGVARIGPVYTPHRQRGRGYAAAAVAALARRLLDQGARVCLFADQRNPVSSGLYLGLGFRPEATAGGIAIDPDGR